MLLFKNNLVVFHPILLFRPILLLHFGRFSPYTIIPTYTNFTPYFHDCKKLLLSFEFYPVFSRAGGKLLFWKNASDI